MTPISIITVVKNGAATISCCVRSIQSQTHPCEHIVIDGGSVDGTPDLVRRCSPSSRIFSGSDHGIYDAMNKGLALASGEVIGILNADDFYASPEVLARVAAVFSDEDIDACYGDLVYVTERRGSRPAGPSARNCRCSMGEGPAAADGDVRFKTDRYWKSGPFRPGSFYRGWMPPHPTFFVRRRVYERYGDFNLALGSAADYELMLRFLLKRRMRTAYIPEVIVCMRTGGASNASLLKRVKANRMDRRAWDVNGLTPHPWTLILKPLRKLTQYFCRKPAVPECPARVSTQ
jgi:glycosyltransferase involved in cell wall biosynthesis